MPELEAFRAIRYNLGHVGSLSDVVTPPYDVIGPELQDHFYKLHPNSFIHIDLNRIEPGDDDERNNRYTRAARFFKQWLAEGVFMTEGEPAIYVYHQEFTSAGTTYIRRGFMARQKLSRFGEGQVFPHEETLPAAKVDRLMLTVVTKANLSPIFGLYPDPQCEAQNLLDAVVADKTPLVATDHLGVVHRLWPVTDVSVISKLSAVMGPKPLFIADGHHRYETACNYREQIFDSGFLSPTHPANYTLMMCVAMDDPGLIVQPTHRLFRQKHAHASVGMAPVQKAATGGRADAAAGVAVELPPQQPAADGVAVELPPQQPAAAGVAVELPPQQQAADGVAVELPPQQHAELPPQPIELPPRPPVDLSTLTSDELAAKLHPFFTTRPASEGPEMARTVWEDIETGGDQGSIGLYTRKDGRWLIATLTDAGRARMAEVAQDHSEAWQSLGVSLLHRLIIGDILGCTELPKPGYIHLIEEVAEGLRTGEYPLAAVLMPATVEHVRIISLGGERMPAKSTYFYPKLLSGLVINPVE